MAFIGKEPQTGAYSMLDSLTASATASYSLTLDSVAFVPESANHLLVSLNGSIQKAGSSYTVSGSTLTFSSTLASSDSIDFVLALGNVLDIGVPSDATVTNAKTNFVSTSSSAGLDIKGDGTTAGTLRLMCEQGSHGVKIASPAHSAGQSYTLTLPTGNVTADKFLKVESVSGSGSTGIGQLSFADAGGFFSSTGFYAYLNASQDITDATTTTLTFNTEVFDLGSAFNTSTYSYTPPSTGYYYFEFSIMFKGNANDNLWKANIFLKQGDGSGNFTDLRSYENDFATAYGNKYTTTHGVLVNVTSLVPYKINVYIRDQAGNPTVEGTITNSYFQGYRVA